MLRKTGAAFEDRGYRVDRCNRTAAAVIEGNAATKGRFHRRNRCCCEDAAVAIVGEDDAAVAADTLAGAVGHVDDKRVYVSSVRQVGVKYAGF